MQTSCLPGGEELVFPAAGSSASAKRSAVAGASSRVNGFDLMRDRADAGKAESAFIVVRTLGQKVNRT